jgi:hypothetical protein
VVPLHLLAAGTRLAGHLDQAAELYAESLELNRRLGDRRMVGVERLLCAVEPPGRFRRQVGGSAPAAGIMSVICRTW